MRYTILIYKCATPVCSKPAEIKIKIPKKEKAYKIENFFCSQCNQPLTLERY